MPQRHLLLLLPFVVALACRPTSAQTTVEQILAKYVEAIGGAAAVKAPTSSVMKGTIAAPSIGATGTIEVYAKAPNKQLTEIASSVLGNSRFGFNGTTGWRDEDGELKEMPAYPKREADFYLPIKLQELYPRIDLIGTEAVGSRRAYRLEAPRGGNPKRWYFDVDSGLLLRMEVRGADGTLLNREDYEDYRAAGGIRVPFTTRQLDADGAEVIVKLTEVKYNIAIDDARFDQPAARQR